MGLQVQSTTTNSEDTNASFVHYKGINCCGTIILTKLDISSNYTIRRQCLPTSITLDLQQTWYLLINNFSRKYILQATLQKTVQISGTDLPNSLRAPHRILYPILWGSPKTLNHFGFFLVGGEGIWPSPLQLMSPIIICEEPLTPSGSKISNFSFLAPRIYNVAYTTLPRHNL